MKAIQNCTNGNVYFYFNFLDTTSDKKMNLDY